MKQGVLVVGAGPVGLTMAEELARYGVDVRIVDKAEGRNSTSRALVVWSRTMELLERTGLAPQFLDLGHRARAVNVVAGNKRGGQFSLEASDTKYDYALMVPQSETERLLEEKVNALGVTVERQVELAGFTQALEGVSATLNHADGASEEVETGWLIACDGAHSRIRHIMGFSFEGDTLDDEFLLADIKIQGEIPSDEVWIAWHPKGVLAIFPFGDGRFRVIANVRNGFIGGERAPDPTLEDIQAVLDERGPGGWTAFDPVWLAAFKINDRIVQSYRSGRVFLAGDAAHIHSPAGGQGMNTGMQDSFNLAWKLALVCNGTCLEEPLLGSYNQERWQVGKTVVDFTGRVTSLGMAEPGPVQILRDLAATVIFGIAPVTRMIAAAASELSVGYPHSPLNSAGHLYQRGPKPGSRAPIRPSDDPVGTGHKPLFSLFAAPDPHTVSLARNFPELIDPQLRPPFEDGGMWLVRPDGYVAAAVSQDNWPSIVGFLSSLQMPVAN